MPLSDLVNWAARAVVATPMVVIEYYFLTAPIADVPLQIAFGIECSASVLWPIVCVIAAVILHQISFGWGDKHVKSTMTKKRYGSLPEAQVAAETLEIEVEEQK